jgi:hypothetical protein
VKASANERDPCVFHPRHYRAGNRERKELPDWAVTGTGSRRWQAAWEIGPIAGKIARCDKATNWRHPVDLQPQLLFHRIHRFCT